MRVALIPLLLALVLFSPCMGKTQPTVPKPSEVPEPASEEEPPGNNTGVEKTVDDFHQKVSQTLLNSATYFDDFFSDERSLLEENQTQLLIQPLIGYEKDGKLDTRVRIALRLRLPSAKNRLNLIFTSNIDDEEDLSMSSLDSPINEAELGENNDLHAALQYISHATRRNNVRFNIGVKVSSDPQIYGGARYRYLKSMEEWDMRFIQRIRYYSRDKWDLRSTLDFEKQFSKKYLARLAIDGAWYTTGDNGFRYSVRPSLYQYLSKRRAVKYEWGTYFESQPAHRITNTVLSLSYRQRVWREWFLYEITPQIAFPREEDFEITPSIYLKFEIEFGFVKKANEPHRR